MTNTHVVDSIPNHTFNRSNTNIISHNTPDVILKNTPSVKTSQNTQIKKEEQGNQPDKKLVGKTLKNNKDSKTIVNKLNKLKYNSISKVMVMCYVYKSLVYTL